MVEVQGTNDVVLGRDARLSGTLRRDALVRITDIGLCGTEEIYYAADHAARLTPADEKGFTLECGEGIPVTYDFGLLGLLIIGFKSMAYSHQVEHNWVSQAYEYFFFENIFRFFSNPFHHQSKKQSKSIRSVCLDGCAICG
nr:hypothetical protein [uncultured Desulfovibrio sp.]